MATSSTPAIQLTLHPFSGLRKALGFLIILWAASCLTSCNQGGQTAGSKKRLRLAVGEIREVTLPGSGDGSMELVGTSDNQEIVEVSRRELAPPVDTLKRTDSGSTIFQLKGITAGKANVVFSKKSLGATGSGQALRTYLVEVTAQ